jgi:hypothetical protein
MLRLPSETPLTLLHIRKVSVIHDGRQRVSVMPSDQLRKRAAGDRKLSGDTFGRTKTHKDTDNFLVTVANEVQ